MNSLRMTAAALVVAALGGCAANPAAPSDESILDTVDRFQSSSPSRFSPSAECRGGAIAYCEYGATSAEAPRCTCMSQDEVRGLFWRPNQTP